MSRPLAPRCEAKGDTRPDGCGRASHHYLAHTHQGSCGSRQGSDFLAGRHHTRRENRRWPKPASYRHPAGNTGRRCGYSSPDDIRLRRLILGKREEARLNRPLKDDLATASSTGVEVSDALRELLENHCRLLRRSLLAKARGSRSV